ncbi:uncharacterized protein V6R79_013166 [Siganus canaliculatus]
MRARTEASSRLDPGLQGRTGNRLNVFKCVHVYGSTPPRRSGGLLLSSSTSARFLGGGGGGGGGGGLKCIQFTAGVRASSPRPPALRLAPEAAVKGRSILRFLPRCLPFLLAKTPVDPPPEPRPLRAPPSQSPALSEPRPPDAAANELHVVHSSDGHFSCFPTSLSISPSAAVTGAWEMMNQLMLRSLSCLH